MTVPTFNCGRARDLLVSVGITVRCFLEGPPLLIRTRSEKHMRETKEDVWQRDVHPEGQGGLGDTDRDLGAVCRT